MTESFQISMVMPQSLLKRLDNSLSIAGFADREQAFHEALPLFSWTLTQQLTLGRAFIRTNAARNAFQLLSLPRLDVPIDYGDGRAVFAEENRLERIHLSVNADDRRTIERQAKELRGPAGEVLGRCLFIYLTAIECCKLQGFFASVPGMGGQYTIAEFALLDRARAHFAQVR